MRRTGNCGRFQIVLVTGILVLSACSEDKAESSQSPPSANKQITPSTPTPAPKDEPAAVAKDAEPLPTKNDPPTQDTQADKQEPPTGDPKPGDPGEDTADEPQAALDTSSYGSYIGAKKCKKCHSSSKLGAQYNVWKKAKHSKAFEVLATPKALAVGKKLGIANPQTDDKCLECHETGKAKGTFAGSFKDRLGVQCESCHGPGEKHAAARKADESEGPKEIPPDEVMKPTEEVCKTCHNKRSPTFKAFDFAERCKKIAHPRPGKTPCK